MGVSERILDQGWSGGAVTVLGFTLRNITVVLGIMSINLILNSVGMMMEEPSPLTVVLFWVSLPLTMGLLLMWAIVFAKERSRRAWERVSEGIDEIVADQESERSRRVSDDPFEEFE